MSKKIAIKGFGRIGRCVVRALHERGVGDLELVAINDLTNPATLAHLYNYDTVHGRAEQRATAGEGKLTIAGKDIKILAEKEPGKLPWKDLCVDIVFECTGLFTDLRGNPGGLLDQAVEVCEKFLPRGQLVVSTEGRTSVQKYPAKGRGDQWNAMPMVVLVSPLLPALSRSTMAPMPTGAC